MLSFCLLQVGVSALAFAAVHPGGAFIEESIIGACLGLVMVVAEGNLYAPMLAHGLYNAIVIGMQSASSSNM
jgi:membrane protease YdiL (CAAX protease family)